MELREVIGRRRSTRFLLPHRPVEPEKIQRMLEAARLASHWGNVQSLRAIVVFGRARRRRCWTPRPVSASDPPAPS
jgi:nitroreductase